MKTKFLFTFAFLVLVLSASEVIPQNLSVEKIEGISNMFRFEKMYLCGQPNLETLEWLKGQGVDLVVNLRTKSENDEFSQAAFNEEKTVGKLGMAYISIPVGGSSAYSVENLDKFIKALSTSYNKVLVHCRGCGRVTHFMMAYLVKEKGYSVDDAVSVGKQLTFTLPLENLLGQEVTMSFK